MGPLPQTPTPFPELNPPRQHFLNKKFFGWLVCVLVLAGAAYVALASWQNMRTIDEEYVPAFTPRQDDTANWKTYNVQNVFEIKYPSTLQLVEADKTMSHDLYISYATIQIRDDVEIRIMVLHPNSYDTPEDYYKKYIINSERGQKLTISGRQAWQSEPPGNGYFIDTVIFNAPNMFEVMYAGGYEPTQSDRLLYNQILSTFKFIDTTGQFCGGIAAVKCPTGYTCKLDGNYPDAGGTCIK